MTGQINLLLDFSEAEVEDSTYTFPYDVHHAVKQCTGGDAINYTTGAGILNFPIATAVMLNGDVYVSNASGNILFKAPANAPNTLVLSD